MTDPELLRTAIHEAGHAVAFVRLFPDRYGIDLTIELDGESLGSMDSENIADASPEMSDIEAKQHLLNYAVFRCAGFAAVLATGEPEEIAQLGCGDDFEQAGGFLDEGKRIAVALMAQPSNIKAVKHLAEELMRRRTMIWDLVTLSIDFADGEATSEEYQGFLALMAGTEIA